MLGRAAMVAAIVAAASGAARAQVKAGGELALNTFTITRQSFPSVGVEPDGDFLVVWQSDVQDGWSTGVHAQRFSRTGERRGSEFQVNTYTTSYQNYLGRPGVAARGRGGFVIAWASYLQDGDGWGVFARRYQADGVPVGAEFQVNTYTTGYQGGIGPYAQVALGMDARGTFVVVWTSYQDGSASGIFGQRFDASANRLGGEFQLNTVTAGYQASPEVAMNGSGQFVVAWAGPDGSGYGTFARRFDAAGAAIGAEFRVNTYTTANQSFLELRPPGVAVMDSGSFVVVWDSEGQDGSAYGVFGQAFTAAGLPSGAEFRVNTFTTATQVLSAISTDALGNFVVTWQGSGQDGSGYGVFGQRFTAGGARRGAEFQVNTYTTGFQGVPDVGVDAAGNFVVAWQGPRPGEPNGDVTAQRFGGLFPASLRVNTTGNGVLEPGETADVRPSWFNGAGMAAAFAGLLGGPGGPPGGLPTILDGAAAYGTVPNNAAAECSDCYSVSIPAPASRPVLHWDASAAEAITPDVQGQRKAWRLHVGESFTDVPSGDPFYPFVETLLHHGITGGCGGTSFCPAASVTREQMAVFVLVAREGEGYRPPDCATPVFGDVPASSPFCRFVEELVRRGVVAGCGPGTYCPADPVTREQMPVFVLRTLDAALVPPPCAPPNIFADVPETSPFCRWIEELARRGVVTGCGGGNYCPGAAVTREQMGVFLGASFGLALYGP